MPIDITKTLRKARKDLQREQEWIARQIAAIESVLAVDRPRRLRQLGRTGAPGKGSRKRMSAAARKAVSRRMKAYWAERKAGAAKGKGQGSK